MSLASIAQPWACLEEGGVCAKAQVAGSPDAPNEKQPASLVSAAQPWVCLEKRGACAIAQVPGSPGAPTRAACVPSEHNPTLGVSQRVWSVCESTSF